MLVLNQPKPPSIECRSLGKKTQNVSNHSITKEKNSYIKSFLQPVKNQVLIESKEVVQLTGDIYLAIDVYSIELQVKERLIYMFDIQGRLRIEHQDFYRSKLRHMIGASLHKLASENEIRAILINY